MAEHRACPWWAGCLLASPLRRLAQNPVRLLKPFIRAGMTSGTDAGYPVNMNLVTGE